MSTNLSVGQILADLEAQIAHFQAQAPFHARQEAFHRTEKERCESELEKLRGRYEAFKAASASAGEMVKGKAAKLPPKAEGAADDDSPMSTATLISWVVTGKADGDRFGASAVAREINTRFADRLRRPLNLRSVSVALGRMASEGLLKVAQKGRAHHETLYSRRPTKAGRS